jgi:phosphonate transport system substrate-binding protein
LCEKSRRPIIATPAPIPALGKEPPMKFSLVLASLCFLSGRAAAAPKKVTVGILNQQSMAETAALWLPLLEYLGKKTGLEFQLRMGESVEETDKMTAQGKFDFLYSNHNFVPKYAGAGYKPLAQWGGKLVGQILAPAKSGINALPQLKDKKIAFASRAAFIAYTVPCDALRDAKIPFKEEFPAGKNQQAVAAALKAGAVDAAALNKSFAQRFLSSEGASAYTVVWESSPWPNLAFSAHPRVSDEQVDKVRKALVGMKEDAEGKEVIAKLESKGFKGFDPATDAEYDKVRKLYASNSCSE